MRGAVIYGPGDVRVEERSDPRIVEPTDAIIRLSATCICGSDLWPYRGVDAVTRPAPMGHEYVGHRRGGRRPRSPRSARPVRGRLVLRLRQHLRDLPGRLPDLLRPRGRASAPSGAQAERMRVPLADGTLVATPEVPAEDLIPSFLAASDVLGTGWFAAVAAEAGPGKTRRRGRRRRGRSARRAGRHSSSVRNGSSR